ncbi:MAG: putative manganese-dependent inorganic diphosphatase [Eubacteriales bacterium]|nr:putative manganese-dependent inorganic diphosphatase [Eubacteriales bacterium]
MAKEEKIVVIGHKHPDTDSICSAIAYADIKNRTSQQKKYIPMRAGQINDETKYVLNRFEVEVPKYISNIGTQVKDMDIRISPTVGGETTVKKAWELMKENGLVTLPVRNKQDELEGLITISDIAYTNMEYTDNCLLSNAKTSYEKIAETIDAEILTDDKLGSFTNGKVVIGAMNPDRMKEVVKAGDLVIIGDRIEDQKEALHIGVSCIVVGMDTKINDEILEKANKENIVVMVSKHDTFTIARRINQSIPIGHIMKKENLVTFSTEDFTDDIQEIMIKNKHRSFPVINKKGKCIGTISRRNFLDMHKKKVILVDHNERSQAVDNIEKAEIMEIIDHHKLGSLETMKPVNFRNQPVGCTGTILYQIYDEQKLEISPQIAGLLCAAIISDTLLFRSPTCTLQDKMAAGALALIADIDIYKFAKEMFRAGSDLKNKSIEEIFYQDYKKFIVENITFGVGQITSMDIEELHEVNERLLPCMISECERKEVTKVFFMLTDIMKQSSEIIYYGKDSGEMLKMAFKGSDIKEDGHSCYLEGVVSRKKQLIPPLMEAALAMQNAF